MQQITFQAIAYWSFFPLLVFITVEQRGITQEVGFLSQVSKSSEPKRRFLWKSFNPRMETKTTDDYAFHY